MELGRPGGGGAGPRDAAAPTPQSASVRFALARWTGWAPHRIGAQKAGLKPVFERPSAEASARAVQVCEPSGAVSGGVLPPTNDIQC